MKITQVILILAVSLVLYTLMNNSFKTVPSLENINLKDLKTNSEVQINFANKPTILLFFTSWCPYCNEDAPKIVTLYEKYNEKINIYGINPEFRDDREEVKNYIEKYKINYPILLDETGDIYKYYGEPGFPTLFFIDSKGKVIDQIIGSTDIEIIEDSFKNLLENYSL